MFPKIEHLDDLLPYIKDNKQIRVMPDALTGHIIVSYMIQDEDTFAGEHEHFEREARGITFHADGRIASRTLHKFFNIGQRDDVQPEALVWQNVTRIMVKRDGSMVTPVLTPTVFNKEDGTTEVLPWPRFKTKKTFTSKEAENANQILAQIPGGTQWVFNLLNAGFTPTFEMTSPKFPIVLIYEKDELTLLHVRENITGRYLSEAEIEALDAPFPLVENVMKDFIGDGLPANLVSWDKLKAYAMVATGVEGVVIQFGQEMIKLKTVWYCELHRSVTFTRWRDVARSVCSDSSDDLKGAFALTGRDIAPIVKVEQAINAKCNLAEAIVRGIVTVGAADGLDAKAMALANKEHPLFGQIMATFRGKTIDWMAWYAKNHLDADWPLEVIPTNSDDVDEVAQEVA
jgi:RNA ligase